MASRKSRLNTRTLWVLGGLLGLQSLACLGIGFATYSRKAGLERTLLARQKELTDIRTISASYPALQQEYDEMRQRVQFLESSLPSEEYIPTLLAQIEETARSRGVAIQEFRPKEQKSGGSRESKDSDQASSARKISFEMVVHGNYGQMQQFLTSLTQFRKILALEQMNLTPTSGDAVRVSPRLAGKLSFTAYVLASDPSANKPQGSQASRSASLSARPDDAT